MSKKDILSALRSVFVSIDQCSLLLMIDSYLNDNVKVEIQTKYLESYKKYLIISNDFGVFENELIEAFDLHFLMQDSFWNFLITGKSNFITKIELQDIRQKISFTLKCLAKIIKSMENNEAINNYSLSPINKDFEPITLFIVTEQQNNLNQKLSIMLQAVENLYNSTLNDEREPNIKFKIVANSLKLNSNH